MFCLYRVRRLKVQCKHNKTPDTSLNSPHSYVRKYKVLFCRWHPIELKEPSKGTLPADS